MRAAYVIWIEALESPILKGQVIEILEKLGNSLSKSSTLYFFAFQPAHHILLHYRKIQNIKKELKNNNINLIIIPCFILPRFINWFNAKWYIIPLIFIFTFPALLFLGIIKNIKFFHCRSYPITLSALAVKKLIKTRVIFDPRSDFPEENITAGRWTDSSLSYKIWKYLEKRYLTESDVTIAIANTYVEHFKKISPNSRFAIIPNNVDVKKFKFDNRFRQKFRTENEIRKDEILFCYSGNLGNHWHKPEIYAKFIIKLRKLSITHRFLFITPNIDTLKKIFNQFNIRQEEYIAISSEFWDVPKYLSVADFGLIFMNRFKIAMAIKTAEYLAMGLPIITNSEVMGAKEIIDQYKIGLVLKDIENIYIKEIEGIIEQKEQLSLKCRKIACENFSNEKIVKKYIQIYKKLGNA